MMAYRISAADVHESSTLVLNDEAGLASTVMPCVSVRCRGSMEAYNRTLAWGEIHVDMAFPCVVARRVLSDVGDGHFTIGQREALLTYVSRAGMQVLCEIGRGTVAHVAKNCCVQTGWVPANGTADYATWSVLDDGFQCGRLVSQGCGRPGRKSISSSLELEQRKVYLFFAVDLDAVLQLCGRQ